MTVKMVLKINKLTQRKKIKINIILALWLDDKNFFFPIKGNAFNY